MNGQNADWLMALGVGLREQRKSLGLSVQAFSQMVGVPQTTLKAMERGVPGTAIGTWMTVWTSLQVAPGVVDASRNQTLAAQTALKAIASSMSAQPAYRLDPVQTAPAVVIDQGALLGQQATFIEL